VIVTGTRAGERAALESTAPIDVLGANDIRRAGVLNGEPGSALQALLPSSNLPRQSNSGGSDHVRAAQLRGLSPDQVLVPVNGKRRHACPASDDAAGRGWLRVLNRDNHRGIEAAGDDLVAARVGTDDAGAQGDYVGYAGRGVTSVCRDRYRAN